MGGLYFWVSTIVAGPCLWLKITWRISILKVRLANADVAELVDAQVSEACSREGVEVRFFSSAPKSKDEL
jgi:hypothetical protein